MNHYGGRINYISNIIKREIENLDSIQSLEELSGTNGFILVYIDSHEGTDVYQKDLERAFGITRSTASKVISLMEKKNLVVRTGVDGDARLKKLVLTETASALAKAVERDLDSFEEKLMNGLNETEKSELLLILEKLEMNLLGGVKND